MVTVNEGVLENLPYIDIPISGIERDNVERLVRIELENNDTRNDMHPMVDELVTIPTQTFEQQYEFQPFQQQTHQLSHQGDGQERSEKERYEVEDDEGIDMSRYDDSLEALYYANNHYRSLTMILNNQNNFTQHQELIDNVEHDLNDNIEKKRKMIDDINMMRNKRQTIDFKPINDYLSDRWKDGIKSIVDLSVEASKSS